MIDAAVRERIVFWSQPENRVEIEHRLIRRLRTGPAPDADEVAAGAPTIELLLQRYPNWLRIVTSRAIVEDWLARWQALPRDMREPMTLAAAPPPPAAAPMPARNRDPYRLSTPPRPAPRKSYTGVYIAIAVLVGVVNAMWDSDKTLPAPATHLQSDIAPATRFAASPQATADLAARQQQAEAALQRALQRPGGAARAPVR